METISACKPELLSPAGDMERLEMALCYGADAVYLAGQSFGLRASAGNFDNEQLAAAGEMCRAAGAKMYVTVNVLPHEGELSRLPEFLERAADAGADGFIIADLGVMALAKRYAPRVPLHVSTQLGVVNSETARVLHDMGVSRVVLAREMSLEEIAALRAKTPRELELEAFVHGAMCVSFSGRCLLSNYMTGRDANGGECAQPCRWKYHLVEEKRPGEYFEISEDGGTHIMNSRDMCMIEHIPELLEAGVSSLKIEGRMKSAYYAAIATYAYRGAIDDCLAGRPFDRTWLDECMKISHRQYCTGFYFGDPGQYYPDAMYFADASVCAVAEGRTDCEGRAVLTQRNKFAQGDTLELVRPHEKPVRFTCGELRNADGETVPSACRAMMELHMALPVPAPRLAIVRKLKT
ncbi:MAG: U32 family peptidase [Butyricicoccus sp.]|nr:U32 family peptidase [Butyricicoccus sp.]